MPELPDDYEDFRLSVQLDCQDDDFAVYEIWWQANVRYPHLPLSHRLFIAESIVKDLLSAGHIALVKGPWISSGEDLIPVDDPASVLADHSTWVVGDGNVIWMT